MAIKNLLFMFFIMLGVWLLLSASLNIEVIVAGAAVSLIVAVFFSKSCVCFNGLKLNPKALIYAVLFVFVFLFELLKSNFDVARRVLSPSLPVNPGIVEVKTNLKSQMGRLLLANSITLTPGTLTVEIEGDSLFIHWIDVSSSDVDKATEKIVKGFEKYLEVFYG